MGMKKGDEMLLVQSETSLFSEWLWRSSVSWKSSLMVLLTVSDAPRTPSLLRLRLSAGHATIISLPNETLPTIISLLNKTHYITCCGSCSERTVPTWFSQSSGFRQRLTCHQQIQKLEIKMSRILPAAISNWNLCPIKIVLLIIWPCFV